MKFQGRMNLRTAWMSIGFAVASATGLLAQQPPQSGKLTEPVFRVSKNENAASTSAAATTNIAAPHPLDPALELAHQSLALMQSQITDYTAVLVKRERIGNDLGDNEFMFVKIRNRKMKDGKIVVPFSVYLAFLKPTAVKGREVIFVENANEGKLIAHEGGMKRVLGTHFLEPNGYLAMAGQRYPLTDIGIENLVMKLIERGEKDKRHGHCNVDLIPNAKVSQRSCSILQVTHPEQQAHFDFHLAQIFMDDEWKLPVRYAAYGWPKAPGAELEVIEEYTYQNIKFNVGLTDKDFEKSNPDYNFHK